MPDQRRIKPREVFGADRGKGVVHGLFQLSVCHLICHCCFSFHRFCRQPEQTLARLHGKFTQSHTASRLLAHVMRCQSNRVCDALSSQRASRACDALSSQWASRACDALPVQWGRAGCSPHNSTTLCPHPHVFILPVKPIKLPTRLSFPALCRAVIARSTPPGFWIGVSG